MQLTESYAMFPGAAVSGFYFAPGVEVLRRRQDRQDQVEDMAKRRGARSRMWNAGWRRTCHNVGDPARGTSRAARGALRSMPAGMLHASGRFQLAGYYGNQFQTRLAGSGDLLLGYGCSSPQAFSCFRRLAADDQRLGPRTGDYHRPPSTCTRRISGPSSSTCWSGVWVAASPWILRLADSVVMWNELIVASPSSSAALWELPDPNYTSTGRRRRWRRKKACHGEPCRAFMSNTADTRRHSRTGMSVASGRRWRKRNRTEVR
jgi:hypothetical protein